MFGAAIAGWKPGGCIIGAAGAIMFVVVVCVVVVVLDDCPGTIGIAGIGGGTT
jgi:hypothetical protein